MLRNYHILAFEPINIIDRFGTFLFEMTYGEFLKSKYRLYDYDIYFDCNMWIKY